MDHRVLFVGNSGTYVNDMPGIFEHIAKKAGFDCVAATEAPDSVRFVDHADPEQPCGKDLLEKLEEFKPTIVFFQENGNVILGTERGKSNENVRFRCAAAAKKLVQMARDAGAQPYFYIRTAYEYVNKGADRKLQTKLFSDFFGILGATLDVPCANAAKAFDICVTEYPHIDPYGPDRAHHSKVGSYLVAATCFAKVFGTDFDTISPWELDADTAKILWDIARKVAQE
jgi:hypothetical protein